MPLILPDTNEARFWMNVQIPDDPTQCWGWTGTVNHDGYAKFWSVEQSSTPAHTFSFELKNGTLAPGLVPDHTCRNRSCVNPDHIEPVTHTVNVLRGIGPTATNARKTECKRGHRLEGDNVNVKANGNRECRACIQLRADARRVPPDVKQERAKQKGEKIRQFIKSLPLEAQLARVSKFKRTKAS